MPRHVQRRKGAYTAENFYTTTPLTHAEGHVQIDAHDLLDYARARMDVAVMLAADFAEEPLTAVVGFLTGSIGLLATARELLEPHHPGFFRFAPGLAHFNLKLRDSVRGLHLVLNDLRNEGMRRVVLVDEIKSGTQLKTGMRATLSWARMTGATNLQVSAIGVSAAPPQGKLLPPTTAQLVTDINASKRILNPRTVMTRALVDMDKDGLKFRGAMRTKHVGEYDFHREQPTGGLIIPCPNGGATGGAGVTSLDSAFSGLVKRILGLSAPATVAEMFDAGNDPPEGLIKPLETWPDTIAGCSCDECRRLLAAARAVAAARHLWTSVAAYFLSEHDDHPIGREIEYWFAAEEQARDEEKRTGAPPWLLQ